MTTERRGFEEPPDLDADDHAILDRILDGIGHAGGVRRKIDRRGIPDIPEDPAARRAREASRGERGR